MLKDEINFFTRNNMRTSPMDFDAWSCGVTVSTPDSESANPRSNLGRTFTGKNYLVRF